MDEEEVLLYYVYREIKDVGALAQAQRKLAQQSGIYGGRVRIATEGINGTISGSSQACCNYRKYTEAQILAYSLHHDSSGSFHKADAKQSDLNIDWKSSPGNYYKAANNDMTHKQGLNTLIRAFDTFQVKIVKDLVGMNTYSVPYLRSETATHLSPVQFHAALKQLDCSLEDSLSTTLVLDVRNEYEYAVGHFDGACHPGLRQFGDLASWMQTSEAAQVLEGKTKLLMYCTGGVRCEKASILIKNVLTMQQKDVPTMYQLQGGVHRYLEAISPQESKYKGKNFVFDQRIFQPLPQAINVNSDSTAAKKDNGVVKPNFGSVIGECRYCHKDWDSIIENRRCTKCRVLILACDTCAQIRSSRYRNFWSNISSSEEKCFRSENTDSEAYSPSGNILNGLYCENHDYFDPLNNNATTIIEQMLKQIKEDESKAPKRSNKHMRAKKKRKELEKALGLVQQYQLQTLST